jgi:hypothetical protein
MAPAQRCADKSAGPQMRDLSSPSSARAERRPEATDRDERQDCVARTCGARSETLTFNAKFSLFTMVERTTSVA